MTGYPLEIFQSRLPSRYKCTAGHHALQDPYQTDCGHRFCKACIDDILNRQEYHMCAGCPEDDGCGEKLSKAKVYRDTGARRDMWLMTVTCPNNSCRWRGTFLVFERHFECCRKKLDKSTFNRAMQRAENANGASPTNTAEHRTSQPFNSGDLGCRNQVEVAREHVHNVGVLDYPLAMLDIQLSRLSLRLGHLNATQDELAVRIQALEDASYDGVLTWKIADFNRKMSEATFDRSLSSYSPHFFTGQFGYKMCACIYLNGYRIGNGNHVSIFFVIMRGEYDAILKWPFRQKVTFMWIDQSNGKHIVKSFRPDSQSPSFKRPTGDMNIAFGFPLFMPLPMLDDRQHAYVKDDTAFLRVVVDTTDI
ncbi:TNF receptor-associated factor 2-like [Ptychodera flava]|uniref:TNF receptor-associated factor 2-like n=1 Tax=Ptychodera flava TaxID=63121 RepID=UPI003969F200